jgi:hypothetical protein
LERLAEVLPDRFTRLGRKLLSERPQFSVLIGSSDESLARLLRRQVRTSVADLLPQRWIMKSSVEAALAFESSNTFSP